MSASQTNGTKCKITGDGVMNDSESGYDPLPEWPQKD